MILAGLSVYRPSDTALIGGIKDIDAAVAGDLFCDKRMYGSAPLLLDRVRELRGAGKQICFQTPMYMTDRIFGQTVERLHYLAEHDLLHSVIVQDVGLLSRLGREKWCPEIIWNCLGIGRSRVSNREYYSAVAACGASSFLTGDFTLAKALSEAGYAIVICDGQLTYTTMNRECYYMHQHNIYDGNCGRGCLRQDEYLVQEDIGLKLCIDGDLLGRRLAYQPVEQTVQIAEECSADICVFADSADVLTERIGRLRELQRHV